MSDTDNGILASIPGQYISAATDQLPDPVTVQHKDRIMETEMDVPGIGRVKFTAERMVSKHRRNTLYYWSVKRAVLIEKGMADS